jgi:hypothetical protein
MACYTLSDCVLEHLDEGRQYTSSPLNTFAQENNHKIAIDRGNKISDLYNSVINKLSDTNIKYGIISWMFLMSQKPQKWEFIDIDNDNHDIFLEVCCQTIDKTLIVSSENKCKWKDGITQERNYLHNGTSIKILNKDDAIIELKPPTIVKVISENKNENINK